SLSEPGQLQSFELRHPRPSHRLQVSGSLSAGVDREGLWRSDGTAAGAKRLTPQDEYRVGEIVKAGPRLFFAGWDAATGTELWEMHE
ncbi:MAG TPA: hypothetical protein VIJ02_10595, partial [Thermoanaerobaculia bacterium]